MTDSYLSRGLPLTRRSNLELDTPREMHDAIQGSARWAGRMV